MKKLVVQVAVMCMGVLLTGSALGLEIQLAPRTLVLSSGGDQLTIHTNAPYLLVDDVVLDIGDASDVSVNTWADDCGNLVVRCSKESVKNAVGDFDGRFTTVAVGLTVEYDETTDEACETLRVKK